jgi:hypothetical protein
MPRPTKIIVAFCHRKSRLPHKYYTEEWFDCQLTSIPLKVKEIHIERDL